MSQSPGKQSVSGRGLSEMVFFGLLAVALGLMMFAGRRSGGQVSVGTPLPELMASGWLNTAAIPSRQTLSSKVVVVDCWASWCPPCRAAMPKLAKLYADYGPLGVEFIGLTPESTAKRSDVAQFINRTSGFDWPVGYGANPTLDMLNIRGYPTVIVFNAHGVSTWSSNSLSGIEDALDKALAMAGE